MAEQCEASRTAYIVFRDNGDDKRKVSSLDEGLQMGVRLPFLEIAFWPILVLILLAKKSKFFWKNLPFVTTMARGNHSNPFPLAGFGCSVTASSVVFFHLQPAKESVQDIEGIAAIFD